MKNKKSPGDYGYITYMKKSVAIKIVILLVIALTIFFVGFFLNDKSNRNVFTIVAILFVLPGARYLTRLIITIPQKNVPEEEFTKFNSYVNKETGLLISAVVITSEEKVMCMDYIYVGNNAVIGLCRAKKKGKKYESSPKYIQDYLKDGVRGISDKYKVLVVDSEKKFEEELKLVSRKKDGFGDKEKKAYEDVLRFIKSLIV
ncbi:MAG: hypothetical protein K6G11_06545 [Lachnospiraceae bacterium]|nr:hypothetical protein [Lachnospiraceae bacterium]